MSDVATAVELHKSTMRTAVMKMSPVRDIPIGQRRGCAEPGDYHISCWDSSTISTRREFDVTLRVEKSQPQSLKVVVRAQ